jgi:hypothetical protein
MREFMFSLKRYLSCRHRNEATFPNVDPLLWGKLTGLIAPNTLYVHCSTPHLTLPEYARGGWAGIRGVVEEERVGAIAQP